MRPATPFHPTNMSHPKKRKPAPAKAKASSAKRKADVSQRAKPTPAKKSPTAKSKPANKTNPKTAPTKPAKSAKPALDGKVTPKVAKKTPAKVAKPKTSEKPMSLQKRAQEPMPKPPAKPEKMAAKKETQPEQKKTTAGSPAPRETLTRAPVEGSARGTSPAKFPRLAQAPRVAFTLAEAQELARAASERAAAAESAAAASTRAANRRAIELAEQKPQNRKLTAASLADVLGFDPSNVRNTEEDEASKVPEKWQRYYKLLVELRRHIKEGLSLHAQETLMKSAKDDSGDLSGYSQHMADAGTDTFDRDFALSVVANEQEALNEIEAAIKRLHNGTYGICELTGKPISKERLLAVPFARYSVESQAEVERLRRQRAARGNVLSEFDDEDGVGGGGGSDDDSSDE